MEQQKINVRKSSSEEGVKLDKEAKERYQACINALVYYYALGLGVSLAV